MSIPDIQNQRDHRDVPLAKVGVKGLEYPIRVLDKVKKVQHTAAKVDLYADLPRHFKGTHMSRFIEIFHQYREDISMPRYMEMLSAIRTELQGCYRGLVGQGKNHFTVAVSVPVTTLCPCSKAISERGAHNQRGIVTVAPFQIYFLMIKGGSVFMPPALVWLISGYWGEKNLKKNLVFFENCIDFF